VRYPTILTIFVTNLSRLGLKVSAVSLWCFRSQCSSYAFPATRRPAARSAPLVGSGIKPGCISAAAAAAATKPRGGFGVNATSLMLPLPVKFLIASNARYILSKKKASR
jgi:hypothetical protein